MHFSYYAVQPIQFLKLIFRFLFIYILFCNGSFVQAQVIKKAFQPRTSNLTGDPYKAKKNFRLQGDFIMIGNTNLVPQNNSQNNKQVELFKASGTAYNDSYAEFKLPDGLDIACTEIIYAGLYWSGRAANTRLDPQTNEPVIEWFRRLSRASFPRLVQTDNSARSGGDGLKPKEVSFYTPKSSVRLTASDIYFDYQSSDGLYTAYYDVTNFVRESKTGLYTVGDIATNGGTDLTALKHGLSAGWGMIIIYKNPRLPMKDITVYDGFGFVKPASGANVYTDVSVSGFTAAKNGEVKVKLGVMAVEGDRDEKGDYFQIKNQQTGDFENLKHDKNSFDNFFNSSVVTGNTVRNPNREDNFGTDIAVFDLNNQNNKYINNLQQNTIFRFGSTADIFALYNITLAVDADLPEDYIKPEFKSVLNPVTVLCDNGNAFLKADASVNSVKWEYLESGRWKELPDPAFKNLQASGSNLHITHSSENIDGLKVRAKIPYGICQLYNETEIRIEKGFIKQPENAAVLAGKNDIVSVQTAGRPVVWEYLEKQTGLWKIINAMDFENHLIASDFELKIQKADKRLKDLRVRAVIKNKDCEIESREAIIKINTPLMVISNSMISSKITKNN
ncbi:hypothetical protein [Flavobacterium sp. 22076]|uniref:hypothetical protein n=1 Tax=unclassified Flavobacterium TaxID=196869 RepID=UPI003F8476C3